MPISDVSKELATTVWQRLARTPVLTSKPLDNASINEAISIIGQALDESWQAGFSDCEMMQRIQAMRSKV